jgi:hypothetical protein
VLLSTQLLLQLACGEPDPTPEGQAGAAGQAGQAGAAGGAGTGGASFCPSESDPAVRYKSKDVQVCAASLLVCGDEQRGFQNACGCGCIDKGPATCPPVDEPTVHFISRDPTQCPTSPPCALSQTPFFNSCGCGCIDPGG